MLSTEDKIKCKIVKLKPGQIVFTNDFHGHGSIGSVKTVLQRQIKKKNLTRLARGIYTKPKFSKLLNEEILPTAEEVAQAISKRDKARILSTGAYALNQLGLSTQIPLNVVYLTDGSPRKINVGKRTIQFKKTTPKNLALKGEISKLVVQALKEIGKKNTTELQLNTIKSLLSKENKNDLKHDIALTPQWIGEIMANAL